MYYNKLYLAVRPQRWLPQIWHLKSDFTQTIFHIVSLSFNITPSYFSPGIAWHLCLLIGSLIFISWEMSITEWAFTHTTKYRHTHTPQREISWLLKYNYLTAGCHLGWGLDYSCLSFSQSLFLFFFFQFYLPLHFVFSPSISLTIICLLWNFGRSHRVLVYKCFVDVLFKSFLKFHWIVKCVYSFT